MLTVAPRPSGSDYSSGSRKLTFVSRITATACCEAYTPADQLCVNGGRHISVADQLLIRWRGNCAWCAEFSGLCDESPQRRCDDPTARRQALCRRGRWRCPLCGQPRGMRAAGRDADTKERSHRPGRSVAPRCALEPLKNRSTRNGFDSPRAQVLTGLIVLTGSAFLVFLGWLTAEQRHGLTGIILWCFLYGLPAAVLFRWFQPYATAIVVRLQVRERHRARLGWQAVHHTISRTWAGQLGQAAGAALTRRVRL